MKTIGNAPDMEGIAYTATFKCCECGEEACSLYGYDTKDEADNAPAVGLCCWNCGAPVVNIGMG